MKTETKYQLALGICTPLVALVSVAATYYASSAARDGDEIQYVDQRKRALIDTLLQNADAKTRTEALHLWALLPPPAENHRSDWADLLNRLHESLEELAAASPPATEEAESLQIERGVQITEAVLKQAAQTHQASPAPAASVAAVPAASALTANEQARRLWNEGYAAYNAGNVNLARQKYNEANRIDSTYAPAYSSLGRIELDSGNLAEAERLFKTALGYRPSYSAAHNNLGLVYERRGDLEAARRQYTRALEYRPEYEASKKNLARLDERDRAASSTAR